MRRISLDVAFETDHEDSMSRGGQAMRVLVVGDDGNLALAIGTALRRGPGVDEAATLGAADQMLFSNGYDARSSTGCCPKRGRPALRLPQRRAGLRVPVLFLTAYDSPAESGGRLRARRRRLPGQAVRRRRDGRPGGEPCRRASPGRPRCCATRRPSSDVARARSAGVGCCSPDRQGVRRSGALVSRPDRWCRGADRRALLGRDASSCPTWSTS